MFFLNKRKGKLLYEREMRTGIVVDSNPQIDSNKILYTCLMNGVLLYLVMMGVIGCFVTAFEITCNMPVVLIVSFFICIAYGMLYYNTTIKTIGYITVLIGFGYGIFNYGWVVRSGFAAITNIFMVYIEEYLDLPVEREYTEYVKDRNYTVTLCLIFIVIAFGLLINIVISEVKGSLFIVLTTFPIVQLGMYFEENINIVYFGMYIIGTCVVSVFRNTTHYKLDSKKKSGYQLSYVKNNRTYNYITDGKNNWKMAALFACFMLSVVLLVTTVMPRDKFVMSEKYDYLKDDTEEFAQKFALVGFYGMLFDGGAAGGIDRNRLGTAKYVRFDFNRDLLLYLPDVEEINNVYLKGYVGAIYRDNSWLTFKESGIDKSTEEEAYINVNTLSLIAENIMEENDKCLEYRSILVNVGARELYPYTAYYNRDGDGLYTYLKEEDNCLTEFGLNVAQKNTNVYWDSRITYNQAVELVKKFDENNDRDIFIYDWEKRYRDYAYEMYMDVPKENSKVIRDIIEEYGIDECEDKVEGVNDFLEANYEYTLIPGKVPKDKDFVNYFLTESKKGYCTYFASSAVLFYRELGIPARYVGGYAIDRTDITGSQMTSDEYYSDFILDDGDDSIGIREVEIDDSFAHAWVEVYVDGLGWIVTDPTPPDYDSEEEMEEIAEEEGNGALTRFITTVFSRENASTVKTTVKYILITVFVCFVSFVIVYFFVGMYIRNNRRNKFICSLNPRKDIFSIKKYLFRILKSYKCKYLQGMTYKEYADRIKEYKLISDKKIDRAFEIYEKAKYCEDKLTSEECSELSSIVYELRENVYVYLKWYKKFVFKYVKLL
ncbi:MAG: transglutaminase domain-containing protein [Lachnospiraceae bacterium]|nr:transglutaminase domain-containing protein [Lachnospiraceae bacterium]